MMLKKLVGIAIVFLGAIIFALGLIKPVFDMVIGTTLIIHVILGIAIMIFGVYVIKKD